MELWTSFISPRRPNIEPLSYVDGELVNSSPDLILVKTGGLGCVPTFNLQKVKDFETLPFPTLLNTGVRPREVEDCNPSNTEDFGLFVPSSSSFSIISFAAIY